MNTLVVTDLDGTLWDNDLRCHPATAQAVAELRARDDVTLIAATGRRQHSAHRAFESNGFVLPSVLLNGALGYDFAAAHRFHSINFAASELCSVLDVLGTHSLAPVAYLNDASCFAVSGVTTSVKHLESLGSEVQWGESDELAVRDDVLGMSMLGVEHSLVVDAVGELAHFAGAEVAAYADHYYPPFSMMIAPADVTKWVGIQAWCGYTSFVPDRVIAIGDGGNDLAMLENADLALAVRGADQRAIDLADHLIEHPSQGGWAAVLDYL